MNSKTARIISVVGFLAGVAGLLFIVAGEMLTDSNVLGFIPIGLIVLYFLVAVFAVTMISYKNDDKAAILGILGIAVGIIIIFVGAKILVNDDSLIKETLKEVKGKEAKAAFKAELFGKRDLYRTLSLVGGAIEAAAGALYLSWKPVVHTAEEMNSAALAAKKEERIRAGEKPGSVELIQSYLMVGGTIMGVVIFVAVPLIWVIRWCLFKYKGYGKIKYVGFDNFVRVFTRDPKYWQSVGNTFVFAIGKLLVEIPLALVTAFILTRKIKFRNFFRAMYFMPSMISVAIMGVVFSYLFSHQQGVVNSFLKVLGAEPVMWFSSGTTSMIMLMIASIWQNFGLNMLFFMTGLQSIDPAMYEAATVDGASNTRQFFSITLPLLGPVLQMVLMNAILGSLKVADLVLTFTNGRPNGETEVMMTKIYKAFFETGSAMDYGYGAALTVVTAIILGLVTLVYLKSTNKSADVY